MRYLIDGYNLIFRTLSPIKNLSDSRQITLSELSQKVTVLGLDATIVFDAQYTPEESSRGHFGSLEVHFTSFGETADHWLIQTIEESSEPSQMTIITSDRQLGVIASRMGTHVVKVEVFLAWLEKRCRNKLHKDQKKTLKKQVIIPPTKIKKPSTPPPEAAIEEWFEHYHEVFSKDLLPPETLPEEKPIDLNEYYERKFKERLEKNEPD